MEPKPPATVWLHPHVNIRQSSIEGNGLFATTDLAEGVLVIRLGGRLVTTRELAELFGTAASDPAKPYIDTITVHEDTHLVLPLGSPVHFGNHSCDPNVWHVGPYELATRRPIAGGEELTMDYGTNSGISSFAMVCRCGSSLCRGTITGGDWRRADLRERYGRHWVPALLDRITFG